MKHLLLCLFSLQGVFGCFPTSQRTAQFGVPNVQFAQAPVPQTFIGGGGARVAAAGRPPSAAISAPSNSIESLLGNRVALSEFTADGYNSQGGGPVTSGNALTCNFDGRPCCWANVPPPDDQIDWQIATGAPDTRNFPNAPAPAGSYLVAYARAAAPSDEAQFASCSIGCASSDITVRIKHWQSENVLLQVCLRESFPNNVEYNPLLNCQAFPFVSGLTTTEVVLPKTSLVDIVFVASNFVGEHGDMAIIDDIEVSYDRNGEDCQKQDKQVENKIKETEEELQQGAAHRQTLESSNQKTAVLGERTAVVDEKSATGLKEGIKRHEKIPAEGLVRAATDRFGEGGFQGGESAFGGQKGKSAAAASAAAGASTGGVSKEIDVAVIESVKRAKGHGQNVVKGTKTTKFSETICLATKCDFEQGNTCSYKDAHQSQSIRGLTTKFQVVSGQFMNRVTGVKESIEGDFYAATFLFPREMAGLEASTDPFTEKTRLRFQYYEGTHGVQLKGCCGSIENCPFSSDKFVSVSDRVWKTASFRCPKGTDKVIFVCENTRTNQGACAVDDLGMVETEGDLQTLRPLC